MSAAPGLETLLELNAIFDRDSDAAPDDFLVQTLPEIAARIPRCRFVRVHALAEQTVLLRAATDHDLPRDFRAMLADHPTFAQVQQTGRPAYAPDQGVYAVPLLPGPALLGLMEIGYETGTPAPEDQTPWIVLAAEHFAQVYKNVLLRDLIYRQNQASVQLTKSRTFTEMVGAIGSNMLVHGGQFVTINLAEYDNQGEFARLRVVASANRRESYAASATLDLSPDSSWGSLYASFESNNFTIVNYVADDESISKDVRDWLAGFGIRALCSLPLRSQDRTFGYLGINDLRGAIALSEEEVRVYQQLADQVSALVQIYNLAEESTFSRVVSERQSQAFAELRTGQDYIEMAGIIARHMLPLDGQALSINRLIRNEQNQIVDWQVVALANRDNARAWDGPQQVNAEDFSPELRQSVLDGRPYVINDIRAVSADKIGEGFMNWIQAFRFKVLLNIPVMVDRLPIACISVFSQLPRPFTTEEVNALGNLADQVGVLMHTSELLNEARSARSLANDLVLANRLVKNAETYDDMAKAVIYTVGNRLTAAGLVLFDHTLGAGNKPEYRSLVALVTAENTDETNATMPFDVLPDATHLENLRQGLPVIIPDIYQDTTYITAGLRGRYAARELNWDAVFGLRAGDQLIGTLEILHTESYQLTSEETDAFTTLADQIGLTLQSRHLLRASREAQSLANQLVQTSREITLANSSEELAAALIKMMPAGVTILSMAMFDQPLQPDELPQTLEFSALASREGVVEFHITEYTQPDQHDALRETLNRLRSGEIVHIPDIRYYQAVLTPKFLARLRKTGIFSILTFGLRVGNRLLGILTIGSEQALPTDEAQLDNFRVIADQVSITVENRLLLNQTETALKTLQDQYNIASIVHENEASDAILGAIHGFVGSKCRDSYLGVIDTEVSLTVVHIVAETNNGYTRAANRYIPLHSLPAWDTLAALETLYIADINLDEFLMEQERSRLRQQGIGGMLVIPLVASQQLLGVIVFSNPAQVSLPPEQLRALRNLGDQLAIVLENGALLRSTAQTLEETQVLYVVTRSILATQDTMDVLRTLRQHLSPEASLINHFTVTTDNSGRIEDIMVDYVNALDDERVVQVSLRDMIGFDEIANALQTSDATLEIIEDLQADNQAYLLRDFAALNGFRSYIHFIIRERGHVQEMVTINFESPQVFDESYRRLFRTVADQIGIVLQNHRLLRETQVSAIQLSEQVETLSTLNSIFNLANTSRDEKVLLDSIVVALVDLLKVDHAAIVLLDSTGLAGDVITEHPDHGAIGIRFDMQTNPLYGAMAKQDFQPVVVNNLETYPGFDEATREMLAGLGVKAMLLVAIMVQGNVIGSLGLDIYNTYRQFTPEMVNIAQTVMAQAGVTLQNLRLLQDTQRRAEQLQVIAAFSQQAQAALDVEAILTSALKTSAEILPQDSMRVALYDSETAKLRVVASQVSAQPAVMMAGGTQVPISGHIATVWETRSVLHIADLHAYPRDPQVDVRTRDWMIVPMISQGRVVGMVSAGSTQPHVYSQTDVAVFQQFVNQLGAAIESARVYNQSQHLAQNESLINEISTSIQRQHDIQGMLGVAAEELGRALGARQARVRLTAVEPNAEQE